MLGYSYSFYVQGRQGSGSRKPTAPSNTNGIKVFGRLSSHGSLVGFSNVAQGSVCKVLAQRVAHPFSR